MLNAIHAINIIVTSSWNSSWYKSS